MIPTIGALALAFAGFFTAVGVAAEAAAEVADKIQDVKEACDYLDVERQTEDIIDVECTVRD